MIEQTGYERPSRPERYINRLSSTIVVLFKIFDGVIAGFAYEGGS